METKIQHLLYTCNINNSVDQLVNRTRGPMGLYRSPGFCHIYSLINLWP